MRVERPNVNVNENTSPIDPQWFPSWASFGNVKSVGAIMDENRGLGSGFDFLRLFLSVPIVIDHCYQNFLDDHASTFLVQPAIYTILGIFFALSGFLVTGSAIRTIAVPTFLSFRVLRLVPALTVETILSALVIGPVVTTVPLHDYFSRHSFFTYCDNIVGQVQTTRPGVAVDPSVKTEMIAI
jgi:peptidoglycan/LPS O-acetylase OafA/YrhL